VRYASEAAAGPADPPPAASGPLPGLDSLADEMTGAILREAAEHALPANGVYAKVVRRAARAAIVRYLNGLTADLAAAMTEAAGTKRALRRRLLELLLSDPQPPYAETARLAREAGWRIPRRVAAVVFPEQSQCGCPPLSTLPADVLADMDGPDPCLLVPDPDGPGRARRLETALGAWPLKAGTAAAVGPAVPLARACASLGWARQALTLAQRGLIPLPGGKPAVVWCDEHLATLVLLADPELVALLGRQVLAPLRRLRPDQADRLAETLLAWLESADNAETAARLLHVHPQTVRYRLRQLTQLFGDALTDPEARFRLLVALRASAVRSPGRVSRKSGNADPLIRP
jgi:hypothetical protein